jgi:hypothetical protein
MYSDSNNCNFSYNNANNIGGVLVITDSSTYTNSSYCRFENNFAVLGGVLFILE